jgi:hypothetical protein
MVFHVQNNRTTHKQWEVSILFLQCIIFPTIDVLPLGYGQIYNILSNDNQYDVIINNCFQYVENFVFSYG